MNKELKFSTKFDTSDFDKAVDSMQKKLKDMYAPSDAVRLQRTSQNLQQAGFGAVAGAPNQGDVKKKQQDYRKELEGMIRMDKTALEDKLKALAKEETAYKKISQQYQEVLKKGQEDLDLKKQLATAQETLTKAKSEELEVETRIGSLLQERQRVKSAGAEKAIGKMTSMVPAVSLVGELLSSGSKIAGDLLRRPIDTAANSGRAISSTVGREIDSARTGQSAFDLSYLPEKQKAAKMANDSMRGVGMRDLGASIGDVLLSGLKGAGIGAGVGSMFAGVGAIPGAVVGGIGGIGSALTNKDTYNTLSMSGDAFKYKDAKHAKEWADNFNEAQQSLIEQDPLKKMAHDEFQQNWNRNLQIQRGTGMGDEELTGVNGRLKAGANAGFSSDVTAQTMQEILGAGGSSRAAGESATFGNQLQRGMNLTNSSQVLGTLSGSLGSSKATEQATIKILAEGMKIGLDDSKFAEENRRFTQAAADIINKTGSSAENAGNIAGKLGDYTPENTNRGIAAGQNAYERFQSMSSESGGVRGTMKAASYMSDPTFSKLSTIDKQALSNIPENQLDDSPFVEGLAKKAGVPLDKFIEAAKNAQNQSVSRFKERDQVRDQLKKAGVDVGKALSTGGKEYRNSLPENVQSQLTKLQSYDITEHGFQGNEEQAAFEGGQVGRAKRGAGPWALETDKIKDKMETKTGRAGDETMAAMAENSKLVIDTFAKMKDQIVPTADAMAKFNAQLKQVVETINSMPESDRNATFKVLNNAYSTTPNSSNQTQTGKNSK